MCFTTCDVDSRYFVGPDGLKAYLSEEQDLKISAKSRHPSQPSLLSHLVSKDRDFNHPVTFPQPIFFICVELPGVRRESLFSVWSSHMSICRTLSSLLSISLCKIYWQKWTKAEQQNSQIIRPVKEWKGQICLAVNRRQDINMNMTKGKRQM